MTIQLEQTTINHVCTSSIVDIEAVFKCPLCPSYERRINMITGNTRVTGENQWRHGGVAVETKQ